MLGKLQCSHSSVYWSEAVTHVEDLCTPDVMACHSSRQSDSQQGFGLSVFCLKVCFGYRSTTQREEPQLFWGRAHS